MRVIAGPCQHESFQQSLEIAQQCSEVCEKYGIDYYFKASFDKANRTSITGKRGIGITKTVKHFEDLKYSIPELKIVTDVHESWQIDCIRDTVDVIQIPAFLCRQTDLIRTAVESGKIVNIKKGQFLAPWDMENVVTKASSTGNRQILLTERGTCFGYNNLVVDMRSFPIMQQTGCPVVFDATHSVQLPGGAGSRSSGQREFAGLLAGSAVAAGADALFLETHPDPDRALCDGPNSVPLSEMEALLRRIAAIRSAAMAE